MFRGGLRRGVVGSISIVFLLLGMEGRSNGQVSRVRKELTTREIVLNYPNHAPGSGSINLFGQDYNNALYLEPLGRALYQFWCPGVDGRKRYGEYVWDVLVSEWQVNTKKYSVLRIDGGCADDSRKFSAGALISITDVQEAGEARIVEFSANRDRITLGESVTLTWKMENMVVFGTTPMSILAGGGVGNVRVPLVGSMTVTPRVRGPVNYLLMGWGNKDGRIETIQKTIQIIVD